MNALLKPALFGVLLLGLLSNVVAQDPELLPNQPVEASLETAGESLGWGFFALQNEMLSFRAEGSERFDPILTILDPDGNVLIINDDYAYPESRSALIEGITMPRTGQYRLLVTGYAGSTGDFTLEMRYGYGELVANPAIDSIDWNIEGSVSQSSAGGILTAEISGVLERGLLVADDSGPFDDFYVHASFPRVQGRSGWIAGLALRWQPDGSYYSVEISSEGLWRMLAIERGNERIVRDWTSHPGISANAEAFTLGVLANGPGFEVFVNGQVVGQALDDAISNGRLGVVVLGANAVGSSTQIDLASLTVTAPSSVGQDDFIPNQLIVGNASQTVRELERRRLIPPGGSQVLNVPESFIELRQDGVSTLPLGRGTSFATYALSTTATLQAPADVISGCGLVFRQIAADNYSVAFLDNVGGFGISERRGNVFSEGSYNENPDWTVTTAANLLILVNGEQVVFYVNGQLAAQLEVLPSAGQVGNLILNYGTTNSVCRFRDTWLWQWPS